MFIELLEMNGYGQYVWPAFASSFAICFFLYAKTRSELKKYEQVFLLEFKDERTKKIEFIKKHRIAKEALSIN